MSPSGWAELETSKPGRFTVSVHTNGDWPLAGKGADAALVFAADSMAWLLNIRGKDVPCVPVVLGYGLLFADGNQIEVQAEVRKKP